MPAYNAALFVRQAVESILAQTLGDFEFIIIDDGSKDQTLPILKELEARDKRIRLISRPNAGVSATANQAIDLARGEFLVRMDSDDIAMPDRLEKLVGFLRANRDYVALGSRVLMIDDEGLPLGIMPDAVFGAENVDRALMAGGWPLNQAAAAFRRDAVIAAGKYRENLSLHEDHDLFLRLGEIGKLDNLPEVLLKYRRHLSSITFRENANSHAVVDDILRQARQRRGLLEPPPSDKKSSPGVTQMDEVSRCRHWAWMSLKSRYVPTARKYAWAGLRAAPLSADSWKLMYCALRGR
jgi:glycosyltransferase involved in cell wall biosynthesis